MSLLPRLSSILCISLLLKWKFCTLVYWSHKESLGVDILPTVVVMLIKVKKCFQESPKSP